LLGTFQVQPRSRLESEDSAHLLLKANYISASFISGTKYRHIELLPEMFGISKLGPSPQTRVGCDLERL
jgi:hypothetical protein